MELVLNTDRLLLRPLISTDVDLEVEMGVDPDVMQYFGGVETAEKLQNDMEKFTRRGASGTIGCWRVMDRMSEEPIGTGLLLPMPVEDDDTDFDLVTGDNLPDCEIEVGYLFKKSAWGKGYATETCKRLLQFAFEETSLDEVAAVTDPENKASQHVLKKSGMAFIGTRRAYAADLPGFLITRLQWSDQQRNAQ